jgi:WhiB family redox-sensing transcriptional regulator
VARPDGRETPLFGCTALGLAVHDGIREAGGQDTIVLAHSDCAFRPSNPRPSRPSARAFPSVDWRLNAACYGHENPDLWFPARGENPADAKAICGTCPVKQECLDFALENRIEFGIWGGLAYRPRLALARSGHMNGHEHLRTDAHAAS